MRIEKRDFETCHYPQRLPFQPIIILSTVPTYFVVERYENKVHPCLGGVNVGKIWGPHMKASMIKLSLLFLFLQSFLVYSATPSKKWRCSRLLITEEGSVDVVQSISPFLNALYLHALGSKGALATAQKNALPILQFIELSHDSVILELHQEWKDSFTVLMNGIAQIYTIPEKQSYTLEDLKELRATIATLRKNGSPIETSPLPTGLTNGWNQDMVRACKRLADLLYKYTH